jgi:hypothetical protein
MGQVGGMRLTIRPLRPHLWPALGDLFGETARGADCARLLIRATKCRLATFCCCGLPVKTQCLGTSSRACAVPKNRGLVSRQSAIRSNAEQG